jgi:pimeloyl-ACP methyl ester carboxylesterase
VFLLHGYNSAGLWSGDLRDRLAISRHTNKVETTAGNFVRMVKYGQDDVNDSPTLHFIVYANTTYSLEDCAVLANAALEQEKSIILQSWAMTRFDLVGHSQGGVLARMLCNQNGNSKVTAPFRNRDNFYRGRFHRVVTIGAPHNGSRLLHYIAQLTQKSDFPSATRALIQPLLQKKFDPFGQQTHDVNNPDAGAPWFPDAGAPFHLVRTSIDGGRSPATGDTTPIYQRLGLALAGGGTAVIPMGSDGIVDADSAAATVSPAGLGANVYDMTTSGAIAHATPTWFFGASDNQVDSKIVGRHVIHALDQNGSDPAENIQFASFQLPPLLDGSQQQMIDAWAARVVFAEDGSVRIAPQTTGLQSLAQMASSPSYSFQLDYRNGLPPQGNANWLVDVYGPDGITTNGVTLSPSGSNDSQVTVSVDPALVGDVVLQAFYIDTANEVVVTPSQVVVSRPPSGLTVTGLQVSPANPTLPVGTHLEAQLVALYSDQSISYRYVTTDAVTVSSSASNVVSVANPLQWELVSPGTAQVVVSWSGLRATNQVTVFVSTPVLPALGIASGGARAFTLTWPSWASDFVLESSSDLSVAKGWQPVNQSLAKNSLELTVTLSSSNATGYFRLRR